MLVGRFVSTILEEGPNPCVLILAKIGQRKKCMWNTWTLLLLVASVLFSSILEKKRELSGTV